MRAWSRRQFWSSGFEPSLNLTLFTSVFKTAPMSLFWARSCVPGLRHYLPVEEVIVDVPIRMKENSKRTSCNSLGPLGPQNKNIGASSQTLLTEVKLRLGCRLVRTLSVAHYVPGFWSCPHSWFWPFIGLVFSHIAARDNHYQCVQ